MQFSATVDWGIGVQFEIVIAVDSKAVVAVIQHSVSLTVIVDGHALYLVGAVAEQLSGIVRGLGGLDLRVICGRFGLGREVARAAEGCDADYRNKPYQRGMVALALAG